jgi:bifunctional UDP-N-acetylglucosamine pyrophosphorylase/glucosamine-1-phosphate N-acetyltransferase
LDHGAILLDPARVDVRGEVVTGKDVVIDVNVVFEGVVRLGDRVKVGPFCVLKDAMIGDDVEIFLPFTDRKRGGGRRIANWPRLPGCGLVRS